MSEGRSTPGAPRWRLDYYPDSTHRCVDEHDFGRCGRGAPFLFTAGGIASWHCSDLPLLLVSTPQEDAPVKNLPLEELPPMESHHDR